MPPADHPAGAPAPGASPSAFGDAFTEPLKAAMSFGKFMPGFDFLEQWTRQAHAAMPSMGQWVAPTLDPAELDKRIQDLRTVQFWLEQNARMLGITIQALEVQRMTLATLQGMNVPVDALRESLKARPAASPASPASPAAGTPFSSAATQAGAWPGAGGSAAGSAGAPGAASAAEPAAPTAPEAGAAAVDPMRWWGALTQQFTQLAASTMQEALRPDRGTPDATPGTAPGAPAEAAPAPPPAAPAAPTSASGDDAPRPPRGKARGTSRDR